MEKEQWREGREEGLPLVTSMAAQCNTEWREMGGNTHYSHREDTDNIQIQLSALLSKVLNKAFCQQWSCMSRKKDIIIYVFESQIF